MTNLKRSKPKQILSESIPAHVMKRNPEALVAIAKLGLFQRTKVEKALIDSYRQGKKDGVNAIYAEVKALKGRISRYSPGLVRR